MTALDTVALADCAPQPWRNGGGITHELLTWPPGAPHWQLRVSVAVIARDGPFSRFDGVQRWFAVLAGAGVRLHRRAGDRVLTPDDDPLGFDGAEAPGCTLLAGPTRDLNLMARHDAGALGMARARPGLPLACGQRWRGVYTAAPAQLHAVGRHHALDADSLAWSDDTPAGPWTLTDTRGPAWWLTLET